MQRDLWVLLDDPSSSTLAKFLSTCMMLVILLSIISFTLASSPEDVYYADVWSNRTSDELIVDSREGAEPTNAYRSYGPRLLSSELDENRDAYGIIETFCIMVFTTEYVLRLLASPAGPGLISYLCNWANIIDFISILPWYVELLFSGSSLAVLSVLRLIRLTRITRIFKMSKGFQGLLVLFTTLRKSAAALLMLFAFMGIFSILFATLIYTFESGTYDEHRAQYVRPDGSASPFESIPGSMWWTIVTMTTVGYGDQFPVTAMGKVIAVLTMFSGMVLLSLPITIIGANFDLEYRELKKSQQEESERKRKEREENKMASNSHLGALLKATKFSIRESRDEVRNSANVAEADAPQEANPAESQQARSDKEAIKAIQKLIHDSNYMLLKQVDEVLVQHEVELRSQIKEVLRRHADGVDLRPTPLDNLGR